MDRQGVEMHREDNSDVEKEIRESFKKIERLQEEYSRVRHLNASVKRLDKQNEMKEDGYEY
jgi:predicted RNase H-like nuclease (RuvC/YqgF family)